MSSTQTSHSGPSVRELWSAGRLEEAIRQQIATLNARARQHGAPRPDDVHLLGVLLFAFKDFAASAQAFAQTQALAPDFPAIKKNLGMALLLARQETQALPLLQQAQHESPEDVTVIDALAHVLGRLGRREAARPWGELALRIKDEQAGPCPVPDSRWPTARPLPRLGTVPEVAARQAVIAFSLFGTHPRYLDGAIDNVVAAREHYPGWLCRFYVDDSVPDETLRRLDAEGAALCHMPRPQRPADALFWRFLAAEDPTLTWFLVRDADSVVNRREAAAVAEWLASGQPFHLMRDNAAHTDLMLAGLWGGVAGWLPPLSELLQGFVYQEGVQSRSADQLFLGARVWPRIREHCLIHDSLYRNFNARDFPAGATLPPGRHVGDNAAAFRNRGESVGKGG